MDVVLEIADTFVGDYLYATLLPAHSTPYGLADGPNNTTAGEQVFSTWTYKQSTDYFALEPSEYAYQSAWPRDNVWRQALSLYLIIW